MAEPRSSIVRQPLLRKESGAGGLQFHKPVACKTSLPGPTLGAGPGVEIEGCGLRDVRIMSAPLPLHTECARLQISFANADSVDVTLVQLIN